ncbi:peptidoglycan DD-metalloendopeptidase family protein [Oceanobacter mangrovi]|uniref:peptidoglycan DD-metalloendopeptidase family protein n=1 Tax=Oceanobacter mangrovi TaxID=2862510 RepID=UPI001C8D2764|nr:peptidoglycan DD-metalloendopeptidase family protein [Oceanobacter mangrovi]
MFRLAAVTLVTIVSMTTGCASSGGFVSLEEKFGNSERVVYKQGGHDKSPSGLYTVRKGDTLYSIAWRYGLNHKDLARANGIYSPYTIYPGQKIDVRNVDVKAEEVKKPVTVVRVSDPSLIASKPETSVTTDAQTSQSPPIVPVAEQPLSWVWPVPGVIMAQFSTQKPVNKGIDLSGSLGESVAAAAAGTVVYAGQGLRGYGNLVIIKHDDTFLSAYAHASRILVNEQEVVKAGQTIAETGSTGTTEVKLHFEIRKNGNPVDPLLYLPKR